MNHIFRYCISTILFAIATCTTAIAIPAKPGSITINQPDGTSLQITIHGDEFLNWKTCNGKLVERASDGFFYYASFDNEGRILRSETRVNPALSGLARHPESQITIPESAIYRARELKAKSATRTPKDIAKGSHKFLTILIDFKDLKFTYPKEDFVRLLNEPGYADHGATGSARDYYTENSSQQFDPEFVIVGPFTADKEFGYYGSDGFFTDENMLELFKEIVLKADASIDFSEYDADKDGIVDNLFFYYAGYNEAEGGPAESIWPHKFTLESENLVVDGKKVHDYACTSELKGYEGKEICGIGTFCHEFGHVLGLPDFYDTDYRQNGEGKALGAFSLMSSGGYNNDGNTPPYFTSIEREMLGWTEEATLIEQDGEFTLAPVNQNKAYRINTLNPGEYYQMESRGGEGWDSYIPTGMLLYHIDKSDYLLAGKTAKSRWDEGFGINDYKQHQCCDLVEACGNEESIILSEDIFPGSKEVTTISAHTVPALTDWERRDLDCNIKDIIDNGNAGVTFRVRFNDKEKDIQFLQEEGINAIYIPREPLQAGNQLKLEIIFGNKEANFPVYWYINGIEQNYTYYPILLSKGVTTLKAVIKYNAQKTETLIQKIIIR